MMSRLSLMAGVLKNVIGGGAVWVAHHIPWTHISWDLAIDAVQVALAALFCLSL